MNLAKIFHYHGTSLSGKIKVEQKFVVCDNIRSRVCSSHRRALSYFYFLITFYTSILCMQSRDHGYVSWPCGNTIITLYHRMLSKYFGFDMILTTSFWVRWTVSDFRACYSPMDQWMKELSPHFPTIFTFSVSALLYVKVLVSDLVWFGLDWREVWVKIIIFLGRQNVSYHLIWQ